MNTTTLNLNVAQDNSLEHFYQSVSEFQTDIATLIFSYACFQWHVSEQGIEYGSTILGLDNKNKDFDFSQSAWFSEETDGDFQLVSSFDSCEKRNGIKLSAKEKNLIERFYAMAPEIRELSDLDDYIQLDGSKILVEKNRVLFFDGMNTHCIEI